jgi:FAD-dependent oxidoreductase domain-containing protein 1
LSVGGLRQQFSLPENIQMSLFGAEFLRNAKRLLSGENLEGPDVQFHPYGYLFLATQKGADQLIENHKLQT